MRKVLRSVLVGMVFVACGPPSTDSQTAPLAAEEHDAIALLRVLDKAAELARLVEAEPLWKGDRETPLTPDERARVMGLVAPAVDYTVTLDGVKGQFRPAARANKADVQSFTLAYAAQAAQLRLEFAFVRVATGKDLWETTLNEADPSWGVPAGMFARWKDHVLDSNAVDALDRTLDRFGDRKTHLEEAVAAGDDAFLRVAKRGRTAAVEVRQGLERAGFKLEIRDTLQNIEDAIYVVVLPVQTAISRWMGDTRLFRSAGAHLISQAQLAALVDRMAPGDVIVERRNWYLSNIGLPGFWPHAELYTGTQEDLEAFLDADADVGAAYPGGFTRALAERYPEAWAAFTAVAVDGEPHRIAEAVSEGVQFSSTHEAMLADYIGVLRPTLRKVDRARAIERAFAAHIKPYDFDFDFGTEAVLVCSELVYKSYQQPAAAGPSLAAKLESIAGRMTLPAGGFVELFDAEYGRQGAQLEFVGFLDGREETGTAVEASADDLRRTLTRSKWDWAQE